MKKIQYYAILRNNNNEIIWKSEHATREITTRVCGYKEAENRYGMECGWHTEVQEHEVEVNYDADIIEYLAKVEAKVAEIGKGYTCNFWNRDENMHHINGVNHFCFSVKGDKVHPYSVGGQCIAYTSDFTREQFLDELPNICLTSEEVSAIYNAIWNRIAR